MSKRLDSASPVPLFHQLAEAIRYRIATGALRVGESLPSLRQAADEWGVNLHTVRHAYSALAEDGLIKTTVPRGSVVIGTQKPVDGMDAFARETLRDARTRFNLSPQGLGELLAATADAEARANSGKPVYVVECSETQASDLACQIELAWATIARPWSLERNAEPPDAPIIATYFHYSDIRRRWPSRFGKVHFASIRPDPELAARLQSATRLTLVERDAEMARNIAADLTTALGGDGLELTTRVLGNPALALEDSRAGDVILFAPRVWGALTAAQRADRRAVEIRYVFNQDDLARIAHDLGWHPHAALTPASGFAR